jgi:hypothetical protein
MPQHADPVSALDDDVERFACRYLVCRYQRLDAFAGQKGYDGALQRFVQALLQSLRRFGTDETRQRFLTPLKPSFDRLYGSVRPRRFDFDAKFFVPWLQRLQAGGVVLDFGAGDNSFLPAIAARVDRNDLDYFACDFFTDNSFSSSRAGVTFLGQPSATMLPELPPPNLVLLRRSAHHMQDLGIVLRSIRSRLAPAGQLVLIEDTFNESYAGWNPQMDGMVDEELTASFRCHLSHEQKIQFLKFNDYYSNHVFHGWRSMPLPLAHTDITGWVEKLGAERFTLAESLDLGFPITTLNLHQAATGILRFVAA